jgi:hypothetical protein
MNDYPEETQQIKSLVDYVADAAQLNSLIFEPADPAGARTLTADDVERFNRNGFITPLQAFDAAESASFRKYIDDLVGAVISAPDQRNSYSISSYHVVCSRLYDLV